MFTGTFKSFGAGVLVGIVISAVGISGIFRIIDKGVDKVKTKSAEFAR